jgi:hypothetical protein
VKKENSTNGLGPPAGAKWPWQISWINETKKQEEKNLSCLFVPISTSSVDETGHLRNIG